MAAGPLNGVRILNLTRIWAGPLATRILADLGAEVIKIEAPTGRGPATVPPGTNRLLGGSGDRPWNQQGTFNKLNRNKQSIAIDLKAAAGHALFLRLVACSDVVIENFSARAMPGLGLGYERLRDVNESVIYVAMPGFGVSGPYRDYVALGPSIEPMSGLTSIMGYGDRNPRLTSVAIPDAIAGTQGAAAVLTALERRTRTGLGQFVDLSQHEAALSMIGEYYIERQLTGRQPATVGNGHAVFAPHGTYRCRGDDDWIVIAVRDEDEWASLSELAGCGWGDDPRFAAVASRHANNAELDAAIETWTVAWDKLDLMQAVQAVGVPAGAVLNAPEMLEDPHLNERGFFVEFDQPDVGRIRYPGTPVLIDRERGARWAPAPKLGQHNEEVLSGLLGLNQAEVRELHEQGVTADRPPV